MNDFDYMTRALELAARGLFTTTPNPRVGCVLVDDGVVIDYRVTAEQQVGLDQGHQARTPVSRVFVGAQNLGETLVKLSDLAGVKAGDSSGASRDFFISVLKTAVNFPTTNAALTASATAQAGFWLNWRDRLSAVLK